MTDIPAPPGAKAYRPGNSDEGLWFEAQFCDKCEADRAYRESDGDKPGCDILCRGVAFDIDDEGFPKEWIEDSEGPRCTAFRPEGSPSKEQVERDKARYEQAMAEMRVGLRGNARAQKGPAQ